MRALAPAMLALLLATSASAQQPPQVFALVVGADHYQDSKFAQLRGAVNDANLIANTLRDEGAEVHTLIDPQPVTRQAIFDSLNALIANAKPGDWVFFTYAGHGGHEENLSSFLLPGYQDDAPYNHERIREHEFKAIFDAHPDVNFLFVADACHSASMARSISPFASKMTTRVADYGPVNDTFPPPPAGASDIKLSPNVVFVGAALDTEVAPEFEFGGAYHGATSWYFVRALRGNASNSGDGRTTFLDLKRYIEVDARNGSGDRQTPVVDVPPSRSIELLPLTPRAAEPVSAQSKSPPTRVFVSGGRADLSGFPDIAMAPSKDEAEFIWNADPRVATVIDNRRGDLVAERMVSANQFDDVVGKWRALSEIEEMSARNSMDVRILPKGVGARYREGESVAITVETPPGFNYVTVFDLASDGVVQYLSRSDDDQRADRCYANTVTSPFGADHVIAVATIEKPDMLRTGLASLDQKAAPHALVDILQRALGGQKYALGIGALYTEADTEHRGLAPMNICGAK